MATVAAASNTAFVTSAKAEMQKLQNLKNIIDQAIQHLDMVVRNANLISNIHVPDIAAFGTGSFSNVKSIAQGGRIRLVSVLRQVLSQYPDGLNADQLYQILSQNNNLMKQLGKDKTQLRAKISTILNRLKNTGELDRQNGVFCVKGMANKTEHAQAA